MPFITTWRTDSADQTITIPVGGSTARYSIDWGDSSPAETDITGDSTHTYAEAGIYTVSISGNFERIYLDGQQPNAGRLASIEQWGDMYWTSMSGAFDGAYNMVYNATAAPDLGLGMSLTCPACSQAPPPLMVTSQDGTSLQSGTSQACSTAPPPSTTSSTPGTSPRSGTCQACLTAPRLLGQGHVLATI